MLTLILMLVIVLYKRLIRFLNKKETDAIYAHFTMDSGRREGEYLIVKVQMPEAANIRLEIRNALNEVVSVVHDGRSDQGLLELKVPLSDLVPGRYSYHLVTYNQHLSRSFSC